MVIMRNLLIVLMLVSPVSWACNVDHSKLSTTEAVPHYASDVVEGIVYQIRQVVNPKPVVTYPAVRRPVTVPRQTAIRR